MTDKLSCVTIFSPITPETWIVAGIGNTQLPAHGQGDVEISYIVNKAELSEIIKDVLFVPGLGVNLFSIALPKLEQKFASLGIT